MMEARRAFCGAHQAKANAESVPSPSLTIPLHVLTRAREDLLAFLICGLLLEMPPVRVTKPKAAQVCWQCGERRNSFRLALSHLFETLPSSFIPQYSNSNSLNINIQSFPLIYLIHRFLFLWPSLNPFNKSSTKTIAALQLLQSLPPFCLVHNWMGCAPSVHNWNGFVGSTAVGKRRSPCCEFLLQHFASSKRQRGGALPDGAAETDEIDLSLHRVLRLQPSISIEIGSGVNPCTDQLQTVIFIFGGPGSLKGILTQELAQEFDFVTIGIEELVFAYLPHKVANTVQNTIEMQDLLRRDPSVINLRWVLQMVSARLATSTAQRFIVDIVPELSFIFKSAAFTARDHQERLEEFDRKHNVLFALELFISGEIQLLEGPSSSIPSASSSNGTSKKAKDVDGKELSPEMNQFLRGVDEADKGRLEKRLEAFHDCAEPFLKYFRKQKRVVRLDLKVPYNQDLFRTVRQLFSDFGFGRNNDSIRVVLFLQSEHQAEEIDTDYYNLRKIKLSDICHDREETLSNQIRAIRKYIYRTAQLDEHILVLLKGLNNTDYPRIKQRINFVEYRTTYLDFYIRSNSRNSPRQRCKMPFRAITSTKGEVCLFPESMSSRLCKKIGHIFGEKLSMTETSESARDIGSRASHLSVSPCPQASLLDLNGGGQQKEAVRPRSPAPPPLLFPNADRLENGY